MIRENITIVDGQKYKPGDEIWNLGSFVATSAHRNKRNYEGLSKDIEKLPHYVDTGSSAFCLDTGDYYKYLRSTDTWYKIKSIQSSEGGVSDYKDLNGKPQINGVTLQGNLTLQDLGINKASTPIGEIISYMGNNAPEDYLICDGSEYNISEYQELANHFTKEFGSANYFGGDGETTFSVPDLRGEFLRGSGSNSHINSHTMYSEGNGDDVGKHQSATVTPPVGISFESNTPYISIAKNGGQMWDGFKYEDSASDRICDNSYIGISSSNTNKRVAFITSRPTNTSVLYCIKYRNSSLDTQIITYKDISNELSLTNNNLQLNYAYIENNMINISVQGILPVGKNTFAKILNEKYIPRHQIFGVWYPCSNENDINKVTYLEIDNQGSLYAYVAQSLNNIIRMEYTYPIKIT